VIQLIHLLRPEIRDEMLGAGGGQAGGGSDIGGIIPIIQ